MLDRDAARFVRANAQSGSGFRGDMLVKKTLIGITATTLAIGLAGCIFVGDLLNPTLAASLGLSSGSTNLGSIVVRLSNRTSGVAFMGVIASSNSADPTFGLQSAGDFVTANDSRNLVFDCPVTAIYPAGVENGSVAGTNIAGPVASVVGADGATTDVQYTGSVLLSGQDFACGDLINITLRDNPGATDTTATFTVSVEVIKGN
jgi:hypothetical protein